MSVQRNETLQAMCRDYLTRLRYMGRKHGLGEWISDTIKANKKGKCVATEKEVQMLSRIVDDERISRKDIPKLLCKSYRQCESDGVFGHIKKLRHVGIYSKISALLYKYKTYERKPNRNINKG